MAPPVTGIRGTKRRRMTRGRMRVLIERLERRLSRPDKWWKFEPSDLPERSKWDEYQDVYEAAMTRCNSDIAPWYVVPAERRWFRDIVVTQVLVEALEKLDMQYPKLDFDPTKIVVE